MDYDEDVRLAVYERFARTGAPPRAGDLAAELALRPADVVHALDRLAHDRHIVLDDRGEIVMAHPFSAVPLGFSVMGETALWWGGCAWDSFAVPHLVPWVVDALVATRCPACDSPHAWVVGRDGPPVGSQVAHFLIPAARMWDDVVRTCGNQRIFCSEGCVERWLARTGNAMGYVMDLAQLWRLASGWYRGRLDRGYQRREPSDARDYLREVGLSGAFWGL